MLKIPQKITTFTKPTKKNSPLHDSDKPHFQDPWKMPSETQENHIQCKIKNLNHDPFAKTPNKGKNSQQNTY